MQGDARRVAERWPRMRVPPICEFDGIKVNIHPAGMKDKDKVPHIHVEHDSKNATVALIDGKVLTNKAGVKTQVLNRVRRWLADHQHEVFAAWGRASAGLRPGTIEPPPKQGT